MSKRLTSSSSCLKCLANAKRRSSTKSVKCIICAKCGFLQKKFFSCVYIHDREDHMHVKCDNRERTFLFCARYITRKYMHDLNSGVTFMNVFIWLDEDFARCCSFVVWDNKTEDCYRDGNIYIHARASSNSELRG